jgi:hypothetical protein
MLGFESERERMGQSLRADMAPPSASALEGVTPAAVRALGEAALPQVRTYYDASLEYGRNTMPETGLFYVGSAEAQRQLVALCRRLSAPAGQAPAFRSLDADLDAFEAELLAAYKPPASIEKHPDFIAASSALKEARELNAAGLYRGALLRYLQGTLRAAPFLPEHPVLTPDEVRARLARFEARLAGSKTDHSIGRIFLESAQGDLAGAPSSVPPQAVAIVESVLPRYVAALEPAKKTPAQPAAGVTVTLVRWPYT